MGSIGAPEILVILVVALLVLGPERLPEAARQAGRVLAELRRMSAGFQAELRDAIQQPVSGSPASTPSAGDAAAANAAGTTGTGTNGSTEPRFLWSDLPPSGGPPAPRG